MSFSYVFPVFFCFSKKNLPWMIDKYPLSLYNNKDVNNTALPF